MDTQRSDARLRTPHPALHMGRRGSLSLEYAALIAIVIAAVIGMSLYTKRALSDRWRSVGDTFGYGRQYEP